MPSVKNIAFAKESLLACLGYNPSFIDNATNIRCERIVPTELRHLLPGVEGNSKKVLNYSGLSVLYNSNRRVPFVSAYNIDGKKKVKSVKRAGKFYADPRIDPEIQLSQNGFYNLRRDITEFEIGHMAANDEMAWGTDAQIKAYQTFHFTNSVPQAENLNTGIWKSLESYIINEAIGLKTNKKICVFSGPLLNAEDPAYAEEPNFQIPLLFYKVIVFPTAQGLKSTAFIMSHEQKMIEQNMFLTPRHIMLESGEGVGRSAFFDFKYRKVFQVNISYLEDLSGLNFTWRKVKSVKVPYDKHQVMKIRGIRNAEDAKKASQSRELMPEEWLSEEDLTAREMRNKTFALDIIL